MNNQKVSAEEIVGCLNVLEKEIKDFGKDISDEKFQQVSEHIWDKIEYWVPSPERPRVKEEDFSCIHSWNRDLSEGERIDFIGKLWYLGAEIFSLGGRFEPVQDESKKYKNFQDELVWTYKTEVS